MNDEQNFDIELGAIVPEYQSSLTCIRKIFFDRLSIALHYIKNIDAKRVLDAGCGDGRFTEMVDHLACVESVVGLDLNINTEELNKKYPGPTFKRGNIFEISETGEYDVVTCLDVLEHFAEVDQVLQVIHRTLRQNGYLIVSGPTENLLYKLGRFFIKGTFSQSAGPGAGEHHYNIKQLDNIIRKTFTLVETRAVRFFGVHLFDVNLYQKK